MNDNTLKAVVVVAWFIFIIVIDLSNTDVKKECYKAAQVNHNIKC